MRWQIFFFVLLGCYFCCVLRFKMTTTMATATATAVALMSQRMVCIWSMRWQVHRNRPQSGGKTWMKLELWKITTNDCKNMSNAREEKKKTGRPNKTKNIYLSDWCALHLHWSFIALQKKAKTIHYQNRSSTCCTSFPR